ncbi:MAG TPA: sigma-70 family RNA polymerase sigma factor [Chitinophagaceae bacterium]|jgi:RNA polymerase sigma factor (sigma-70 family)|nr:sigma-70 family RNA polymerase sigma factor [Chitinophagaceae bacterium]
MAETEHIDPVLWEACKAGDKKAYGAVYQFYYPRLYNYGYKFAVDGTLIEDCIQEVFTWCWSRRSCLVKIKDLRSYLFVAFRHCLLKSVRHGHEVIGLSSAADLFSLELAADELCVTAESHHEQQDYLKKAFHALTPRQKEAIFLKFYENMSYEEIAAVLDISVKATYKLIGRAISELRQYSKMHPAYDILLTMAGIGLALRILLS